MEAHRRPEFNPTAHMCLPAGCNRGLKGTAHREQRRGGKKSRSSGSYAATQRNDYNRSRAVVQDRRNKRTTRIRKHMRKGEREEKEGKRNGSRGCVRIQNERAQTTEHVLFGGLTVGHGARSRNAARTNSSLRYSSVVAGWSRKRLMPAIDGGRGSGRFAQPSLSTLGGGGLSDRAVDSGDDGDCDSPTFEILRIAL